MAESSVKYLEFVEGVLEKDFDFEEFWVETQNIDGSYETTADIFQEVSEKSHLCVSLEPRGSDNPDLLYIVEYNPSEDIFYVSSTLEPAENDELHSGAKFLPTQEEHEKYIQEITDTIYSPDGEQKLE